MEFASDVNSFNEIELIVEDVFSTIAPNSVLLDEECNILHSLRVLHRIDLLINYQWTLLMGNSNWTFSAWPFGLFQFVFFFSFFNYVLYRLIIQKSKKNVVIHVICTRNLDLHDRMCCSDSCNSFAGHRRLASSILFHVWTYNLI